MTARILPNGNLLLTAGNEKRRELRRLLINSRGSNPDDLLQDFLEPYRTNGGYYPFEPGSGEPYDTPFVGLTCAPCIAESMDFHDDGTQEIVGRLWWFPDYQVVSPVDELIRRGRTVFTLAGD